ncbi:MAG: branched-chain amino acid ABC transporter permease [Hydrogenophaga sp.]|uniref:branched-chain amino acid ABC transporter permease n=1 Tax=Hydrogenophaga sp. TaxID=1904254 RepID=UPI0025B7EE29|nr:branched-chain amino acid ABC transporter permease [Hydrogenophaga sp.]MBT9552083.1 branched-chain amino acid ABC transporter permease [Hydrogenophaga sp.]
MKTSTLNPLAWTLPCAVAAWLAPHWLDAGLMRLASEVLLAICMAQMWNLLAGYGGLMSLGHQLFIGVGAYALFDLAQRTGLSPFWLLPATGLAGALCAALIAPALFRLRDAYFAIGIWVVAEIVALLVSKTAALGGNAGLTLDMSALEDIELFGQMSFWLACALGIVSVAGLQLLMRSRLGLAMTAVRDNEVAARSVGIDVRRVRLVAFVISGGMSALAGAVYFMGGMFLVPSSAFDVNWVVMMLFATLIGGIGTLGGPVIGVLIWFGLRELLATTLGLSGGWYLIAMGAVAVLVSLYAPRGLMGLRPRTFTRKATP